MDQIMPVAPPASDDDARITALRSLGLMDVPSNPALDAIVQAAADLCGTPIALLTLLDDTRQWFKSNVGLPGVTQTAREHAFCSHTILSTDTMEVVDATLDSRFSANPLVLGAPNIRFYAGAPIIVEGGHALGTLCVIDRVPRALDPAQHAALSSLARSATAIMEQEAERRAAAECSRAQAEREHLRLSSLIEGMRAAIWELNLQTGALRVNDQWRNAIGLTPDDPPTDSLESWWHWMHADDVKHAWSLLDLIRSNQSERYRCEARMRNAAGREIWVVDRGAVLSRTPDGRPEWVVGTLTDISEQKAQEEALRQSEAFLDRVSRVAGIGGWEMDLASRTRRWSMGTYRLHGLEPGTPPPLEQVTSRYAPEAWPVVETMMERAALHGEGWDLELPLIRADGVRIWVRSIGSVESEGGRPVRLVGAIQDVTSRVAERHALEKVKELAVLAAESAGVGIWDWDLVEGSLIWDPRLYRLFDVTTAAPATSALFMKCVHPDDRQRVRTELEAARRGEAPFDTSFRIITSDKSVRTLRGVARTTHDRAGNTIRMVGVNWDVTDAQRLATDLAQQHELLRVTLRSIGNGVITTNAQGLVVLMNPAAERLTGWCSADACGRPAAEVFKIVDAATGLPAGNQLAVCLDSGQEFRSSGDRDLVSLDGKRLGIEDTVAPIRNEDGQIFGAVLVFLDITEQRRIEAGRIEREQELRVINTELERLARHLAKARDSADRANKAKSRFLAGMSHELRTPLNGILGYAQLLRLEGGLGEQQQARVDAMLAAGSHLLEMVNSVLDLSEIEAEHIELRALDVDLREIVAACVDQVRPAAETKRLALCVVAAPDTPQTITTDPVRLRQILLNLLGNAVKFTGSGWVELRMSAVPDSAAARIEVVDTGPGIPRSQREHLFTEFERLGADREGIVEGSGLGLALSARLATLLGGQLGYRENLGGGSVFWLELPPLRMCTEALVARPPATRSVQGQEQGQERAQKGPAAIDMDERPVVSSVTPLRVLVVDDIAMNRDIALSFMKVAGHDASCVDNGMDAIAAVLADTFDVVLMDIRMPGMDGLEATRQIRALDGPARDVPIVGLTAQAFAEQIEACRLAGMDGHLAKPYGPVALMAAMESAIKAKRKTSPTDGVRPLFIEQSNEESYNGSTELPVVDDGSANQLSSFLPPDMILSYMQAIASRGDTILSELARWKRSDGNAALADSVHALTGSAGMFGFARLAGAGRRFEQALRSETPDVAALAAYFRSAVEATQLEIRSRQSSIISDGLHS